MKYTYSVRLACLLVFQVVVNATVLIIDPINNKAIDTFENTEATTIVEVLKGYIESANPPDACTKIDSPTFPFNYTMKKFVLVNGTNECDFMTKIQNVAAVGYDVALVYNPFPEFFNYNITFPFESSNLSVAIILYEDGLLIKNNYLFHNFSGKNQMILEIIPTITWVEYLYALFFGLIIILTPSLFVLLLFMIMDYCTKSRNEHAHSGEETDDQPHEIEAADEHTHRSPEEYQRVIEDGQLGRWHKSLNKKFPLVRFSKDDKFDRCAICITVFNVGEIIRTFNPVCTHAFHMHCIDPWLLKYTAKKKTCPVCKGKIFWESSCEELPSDATENTRLLGSSCPSYLSISGNYSSDHLAAAQGSINHWPWVASDEDDNV